MLQHSANPDYPGEWVQFLDADDYLEPEKIAQQFTETHGGAQADVIYSPVWIEDSNERTPTIIDSERDIFSQWPIRTPKSTFTSSLLSKAGQNLIESAHNDELQKYMTSQAKSRS